MTRTKPPEGTLQIRRTKTPASKYKLPGRKGVYDEGVPQRAHELSKLGLTNRELAIAFGVDVSCIEKWIKNKEEFSDAIQSGKDIHDNGVQQTLLQRAMGYEYEEQKTVMGVTPGGQPYQYTTTTTKRVLPDVTAMIFWLKNRHKDKWADVQRSEITSNVKLHMPSAEELTGILSPEEIAFVRSVAKKRMKVIKGVRAN